MGSHSETQGQPTGQRGFRAQRQRWAGAEPPRRLRPCPRPFLSHTAASGFCLLSTLYGDAYVGYCPANTTQLNLTEIAVSLSSFAAQDSQGQKGKPVCQGVLLRYQAASCTGPLNSYFSTLNQYQKKNHIALCDPMYSLSAMHCTWLHWESPRGSKVSAIYINLPSISLYGKHLFRQRGGYQKTGVKNKCCTSCPTSQTRQQCVNSSF